MNIGEVSKELGLSIDTLRYYEKIGLIQTVNKKGGRRKYSENDIKNIRFILCMKSTGLSLKDVGKFLDYYEQGDKTIDLRLDILKKQKEILEKEIEEKKETLNYLNYKINLYESKRINEN